ncbi:MAG: class III lanthionine synthetase LanKC [Gordonia paraffinivorans]
MIPVEYCHHDSVFFESPGTRTLTDVYGSGLSVPDVWSVSVGPDWTMVTHPAVRLPSQGWKIHVSTTPSEAVQTLTVTAKYCLAESIPFKYLRAPDVLLRRNGKYGPRSGSGKFITIYPPQHLVETALEDLGALLEGADGPYVLTDVRWRSGPLYVRYGGIAPRARRGVDGRVQHLIQDGTGRWVPDTRRPFFRVPDGVDVPDAVAHAIAERDRSTLDDFPYAIDRALHHSNGGGVYVGTDDRTGRRVLIREARPFAGVDLGGSDAVDRLHAERRALDLLADDPSVPAVVDQRIGVEHHYLVREFVEGSTLEVVSARRRSQWDANTYTDWVCGVVTEVGALVDRVNARGVTIGDVHGGNILLDSEDGVHLIDLETASTDPDAPQIQAAIGYVAPSSCRGPRLDRYATGCLALALFGPGLPATLAWNDDADAVVGDVIARRFPVTASDRSVVSAALGPDRPAAVPTHAITSAPAEEECVDVERLVAGILDRGDPERTDRLVPADPAIDATPEGPLSLAHGAAGVLAALAAAGADVAAVTRWTAERVLTLSSVPADDLGWGLFTGLGGTLCALADRAADDPVAAQAATVLAAGLGEFDLRAHQLTGSLAGGLPGIGLAALHAGATLSAPALLRTATDAMTMLRARGPGGPRRRGLMAGSSGAALFATALGRRLEDRDLLDQALRWIDDDLATLADRPLVPTLAGDLGTVLPLLGLLDSGFDAEPIRERVRGLLSSVRPHHIADGAGLFHGWAGTALVLDAARRHDMVDEELAAVDDTDVLRAYSVRVGDHVAVLGSANLRLSDDLATGTCGVVAAVSARRSGVIGVPGLGLDLSGVR